MSWNRRKGDPSRILEFLIESCYWTRTFMVLEIFTNSPKTFANILSALTDEISDSTASAAFWNPRLLEAWKSCHDRLACFHAIQTCKPKVPFNQRNRYIFQNSQSWNYYCVLSGVDFLVRKCLKNVALLLCCCAFSQQPSVRLSHANFKFPLRIIHHSVLVPEIQPGWLHTYLNP